jgi:hypothetical protein
MRVLRVLAASGLLLGSLALSSSQPAAASITYSFTPAGATGRTGPTQAQINTAYAATTLAGQVTINTQGIQEWTAPSTGQYSITAVGGKGGGTNGGKGARLYGEFTITQGTVLKILVGQQGSSSFNTSAGGGGGSFVWNASDTSTPLIAAGGGGGQGGAGRAGVDASTSTSGTAGTTGASQNLAGAGGTGGNPGTTASVSNTWSAAAGAGWKGNSTVATTYSGNNQNNGYSPLNGGVGGAKFFNMISGVDCGDNSGGVGGGGGGYSGGGNGSNDSSTDRGAGGGGGSINNGTNQSATAGFGTGAGYVTIVFMVDPAATSVTLSAAGNVTNVSKSTAITLTATVGAPGKITFFANGKRIPGCISKAVTTSITCNWKPATRGVATVTATLIPTDTSTYLTSQSAKFNLQSVQRSNRR